MISDISPRPLLVRRDGPGLLRLVVQLVALAGSVSVSLHFYAAGNPFWAVTVAVCAAVIVTYFPLMHETGHRTAFRTVALNEIGVWIGALSMLQSPTFFREFHFEHHRSTQDRDLDPEIAAAADLLDGWPTHALTYLVVVSGQPLMLGKMGLTLGCALIPRRFWPRLFPYIRPSRRARVAWESRAVAGLWAAAIGLGLRFVPGWAVLLLAWPMAHLCLGFYLMAEHTGLPNAGSQLERTRTICSNACIRWLMWNMPYHAEHHAHPSVPFHAVPRLHALLEPELVNVIPGYLAFHATALRRALGRGN